MAIGLGAQCLQRGLSGATQTSSLWLIIGWKWRRRRCCRRQGERRLQQAPHLSDGQPAAYGSAGQAPLARVVAQWEQQQRHAHWQFAAVDTLLHALVQVEQRQALAYAIVRHTDVSRDAGTGRAGGEEVLVRPGFF